MLVSSVVLKCLSRCFLYGRKSCSLNIFQNSSHLCFQGHIEELPSQVIYAHIVRVKDFLEEQNMNMLLMNILTNLSFCGIFVP
ncbi:hypothetical protein GDO78_005416 [Eleutherodactylus coqui]|uniref:Uncharacterized protein n=1 Tax=Eleutherodactylus coqui TaxID=57060 RepID=A0A8J6KE07_ELECQ|nr:hypothetical protein GDO78_005416 [Eleutherodactylus coqui]